MNKQFFNTAIAIFTFSLITLCEGLFAQVPEKMNYQGIARDNAGAPLANQALGVRISILNDDGTEAYVETHGPTTNEFGLYTLAIGGGNVISGTMLGINWAGDAKSLKLEIDPAGGGNYTDLGTTELLSSPYALLADNITDETVTTSKLANTAVTADKVSNSAITTPKIANGAVTLNKLAVEAYPGLLRGAGSNPGFRRSDATQANYGPLGNRAIDLSISDYPSTTRGATGNRSFAAGEDAIASGFGSAALGGQFNVASGDYSIAIGTSCTASGSNSVAIGLYNTSSGQFSSAMGRYSHANNVNSFVINSSDTPISSANPGDMTMKFYGGFRFFTNNAGTVGTVLLPGANSWFTASDSTKKENYLAPDGHAFLQKIKTMRLGSWNYIGQDPESFRHYGPMAQEFFALFGNDDIGIIGNDTTIATADIDGVMMIAIQALIEENESLKSEVSTLENRLNRIEAALMKEAGPEMVNLPDNK